MPVLVFAAFVPVFIALLWWCHGRASRRRAQQLEHDKQVLHEQIRELNGLMRTLRENPDPPQPAGATDRVGAIEQGAERTLGVVAHELRTPIASLRAISEYLLDGCNTEQERRAFVRAIHQETQRMAQMVTNMLEGARMNSGVARWDWTTVNLRSACEGAIQLVRPLLRAAPSRGEESDGGDGGEGGRRSPIELRADIRPRDLRMKGDRDAIHRLLVNLLTNAMKHTAKGSIHIAARRLASKGQCWIELSVTDTGGGIPGELLPKLGVAFATNQRSVDWQAVGGTGLGLTICKAIAAAHGGRILVASKRGEGITFTVRLRADLMAPLSGPHVGPQVALAEPRGEAAPAVLPTSGGMAATRRGAKLPADGLRCPPGAATAGHPSHGETRR